MILTSSDKAANPTSVMGASQAARREARERGDELPRRRTDDVRQRPLRQRPGLARLGARAVRPAGRGRRPGDRHRPGDDPLRDDAPIGPSSSRSRPPTIARGGEVFVFKMPVARLADLVDGGDRRRRAARPACDPASIATRGDRAAAPARRRYEELMTEDESTRAHDIGEMFAVLPSIESHPGVADGLPRRAAGARSAPIAPTRVEPMTPAEVRALVAEALVTSRASAGGPAGSAPMRVLVTGAAGFIGRWVVGELLARGHTVLPIDNLVAGDEANLAEFAGHPGLLPFEVGDVRDAERVPALGWRGRRRRPPRRLDLRPGLDRRPGDDVRQRRRRHVQPARGRPAQPGPASCS